MNVEKLLESAGSYTSLLEVADAPHTEEPAVLLYPLPFLTFLVDC